MNAFLFRLTRLLVSHALAVITLFVAECRAATPSAPVAPPPHDNVQSYKPDLVSGRAPTLAEVTAVEQEAAAHPQDFAIMRKLGKIYFYRFFGAHEAAAEPQARAALKRALGLKPDDAEALAFLGSVERLSGHGREGAEIMARARTLDPTNIGVLGLLSGFGDVSAMEQLRALPEFSGMPAHGRQRILLGLGKDRARNGKPEAARALFAEGLAISKDTREARMLAAEMALLK